MVLCRAWLFAVVLAFFASHSLHAEDLGLASSVHQPQITFRYSPLKLKSAKTGGSVDPNDDSEVGQFDIEPSSIARAAAYAYDMEIPYNHFANIGFSLEVELTDGDYEGLRKRQKQSSFSTLLGGYSRFLLGEWQGLSPFVRAGAYIGARAGEYIKGNSVKAESSAGFVYYFSEFFAAQLGYGYTYERTQFFGRFKGLSPTSNKYFVFVHQQISIGLSSTFL